MALRKLQGRLNGWGAEGQGRVYVVKIKDNITQLTERGEG